MAGEHTLKYGVQGQTLTLRKSEDMVAIQPQREYRSTVRDRLVRRGAIPTATLATFDVFDVSEHAAETALDAIRTDGRVSVGSHVYHTSDKDEVPFVPTGEIYILFKEGATRQQCEEAIAKHKLSVATVRPDGAVIARVTRGSPNPLTVAQALQASSVVAVAEPDLATPRRRKNDRSSPTALQAARAAMANSCLPLLPKDELLARQWHLMNNGNELGLLAGADARVMEAWEVLGSLGSPDVVIGIIDDGFDLDHPDLVSDRIIAPWCFTRDTSDPRPDFNDDYPYRRMGRWEGDWHGTACAGVALGNANGTGIVGAAPGCRFIPVRWGSSLTDSQVERWFAYMVEKGAWVVSCSWGPAARNFPLSHRKHKALADCVRNGRGGKGTVVVFAAGNDNRDIDNPPYSHDGFACHPDVIAVSASTSRDEKADYSSYGKPVSVCAPSSGAGGRDIVTSDVSGTFVRNGKAIESGYSEGLYTYSFGGTSSSTPLVAGVCALVLSANPTLQPAEVKDILQKTARKIGSGSKDGGNGHSPKFGYGCVNAVEAVRMACQRPGAACAPSLPSAT